VYSKDRIAARASNSVPVEIHHAAAASLAPLLVKTLACSLNGSVFTAFPSTRVENHIFSPSLMSIQTYINQLSGNAVIFGSYSQLIPLLRLRFNISTTIVCFK
jgi:hypothetical protein